MLKVTQLSCMRNEQEVFSNLTFSVSPGMLLHIQGPNGSGKSSLLKMMAGLLPIEKGSIQSVYNQKIVKHTLTGLLAEDPEYIANLLYIGHKTGVTLSLTAREHIQLWQALRCIPQTISESSNFPHIDNILKELNLPIEDNRLCEALSAGQRQKTALSRLWCESAPLWLLDEPFTAIDSKTQHAIEDRIEMHLNQGGAVILASHVEMDLSHRLGKNYQIFDLGLNSSKRENQLNSHLIRPSDALCASKTPYSYQCMNPASNNLNILSRHSRETGNPEKLNILLSKWFIVFKAVFKRDILLYTRRQCETFLPLVFCIIIISVFSICIESTVLMTNMPILAGPILWVGVLLSLLLSAESLYKNDYESGYLEHLILNPVSLSIHLVAKTLAHCLAIGLPLLVVIPILGVVLHCPKDALFTLFFSFLIGIPALCFIISIGSALVVNLQRGGILLSILLIPLFMPVIIFGCSALYKSHAGLNWYGESYLLMAILLIAAVSSPLISAFSIKLGLE